MTLEFRRNSIKGGTEKPSACERCSKYADGGFDYQGKRYTCDTRTARPYAMHEDLEVDIYGANQGLRYYLPQCPYSEATVKERHDLHVSYGDFPALFREVTAKDIIWSIWGEKDFPAKGRQCIETFLTNFEAWREEGQGLYFYSSIRGSGKTFIACAVANDIALRYGVRCRFVRAADLRRMDADRKKDGTSYRQYDPVGELMKAGLLVLDDITSSGDAYTAEILFRLVDYRMNNKLCTVFTSNLPAPSLQFSDSRIVDRIASMVFPVHFPEYPTRAEQANTKKSKLAERLGITF